MRAAAGRRQEGLLRDKERARRELGAIADKCRAVVALNGELMLQNSELMDQASIGYCIIASHFEARSLRNLNLTD